MIKIWQNFAQFVLFCLFAYFLCLVTWLICTMDICGVYNSIDICVDASIDCTHHMKSCIISFQPS